MVLSYYINKYPYKLAWNLANFFGKTEELAFYCADPIDYIVFENIQKHLPEMLYIAKDARTARFLERKGKRVKRMVVFPKVVIMTRQVGHKFPEEKIKIISLSHGVGRMKKIKESHYFNVNMTLETGAMPANQIRKVGFDNAIPIGFPKLDPAFDGSYSQSKIDLIKSEIGLSKDKTTLLFSATFDKSGMSAIDKWYSRLDELTDNYNILVTLHYWMSPEYIEKIKNTEGVFFIDTMRTLDYLMIADIMIGDTSSIIAEFMALNKPIICFKVPKAARAVKETHKMIKKIAIRIEEFVELESAIQLALTNPEEQIKERKKYSNKLFYSLDGKSGERAAEAIMDYLGK